jgi:hypothetical protein
MILRMNSFRVVATCAPSIWRRLTSAELGGRIARFLVATSLCLAIMVLTEPSLVIVWDEGYSLGREARIRTWFRALADPAAFARSWQPPYEDLVPPNRFRAPRPDELDTRGELLLNPVVLDWFWPFARLMMPVPLSYYSPLVGGLPGATRMGMEPTFYWDALRPEVLDWLNTHTPPGQKVRFSRYPTSWLYLRQTGRLRPAILPTDPGDWAW